MNLKERLRTILPFVLALRARDDANYEMRIRSILFELLRLHGQWITCERNETLWTLATEDGGISKKIFVKGQYQVKETQQLVRFLKENGHLPPDRPVAIDVGANIGVPSIPLAKSTTLQIVAIEPLPQAFQLLKQNVYQNGLADRIRCVQAAIETESGSVDMVMKGKVYGKSEVRVSEGQQGFGTTNESNQVVSVKAERLDSILIAEGFGMDQVCLVWSDTQGHEAQVLESGGELWENGVPFYTEVWPYGLEAHNNREKFSALAKQYFTRYILKDELIERGPQVQSTPVAEIDAMMTELRARGTNGAGHTDILLLP
jgi:FkbM family methyltransferase